MPRPRNRSNGQASKTTPAEAETPIATEAPAAGDMITTPVEVEAAPPAEADAEVVSEAPEAPQPEAPQPEAPPVKPSKKRAKEAKPSEPKPPKPVDERFVPTLEAVLFSTDKPLPVARLALILNLTDDEESETAPAEAAEQIRAAIATLNDHYDQSSRSFRIELVAGGYRVMTRPDFAEAVARLHRARADGKLSRAALETLAIVAYRQPITRADLEAIRGVACGEVLRSLMERRLVAITGRSEELGRPMLYGTTRQFLESFGLAALKDLPTLAELKAP